MQEETEVLGENLRGLVWIENQIHIRLIWPDWKSNPGLIGERHGNNRCANPLAQITTPLLFLVLTGSLTCIGPILFVPSLIDSIVFEIDVGQVMDVIAISGVYWSK